MPNFFRKSILKAPLNQLLRDDLIHHWVGWGCMASCGKKMQTSERESREGCWHCCLLSCEARQGRMVEWKRNNPELEQLKGTSHHFFPIFIFSSISPCSLMKSFALPLYTVNCLLDPFQWKLSVIRDFYDTHLRASGPMRHLVSASLSITPSPHCIWIP